MSFAASFVDYDGDGDHDLYVCDHWRAAHLFRNDGGIAFGEQSDHYAPYTDRHDAVWGDLDNDGAPDQYIPTCRESNNELFWNEGWSLFTEGAVAAGVEDFYGRGREIAIADFDLDADLDIYLTNAVWAVGPYQAPSALFWNLGDGTFLRESTADPFFTTRLHCSGADYDGDGFTDIIVTHPYFVDGELYRNAGGGAWVDMTAEAFPGIGQPLARAQGAAWADYDNDADLDLLTTWGDLGYFDFVDQEADSFRFQASSVQPGETRTLRFVSDCDSVTLFVQKSNFQFPQCYWGGNGESTSTYPAVFSVDDIAGEPPALGEDSPGVCLWSTLPDDGLEVRGRSTQERLTREVFCVVKSSTAGEVTIGGRLGANGADILDWSTESFGDPPPHYSGGLSNRLYRNEGDGTFSDVTAAAFSVNDSTANSKGAAWGDYDNDGWIDVYVSNAGTVQVGNQRNQLYRNNGDGTFADVAATEDVLGSTIGMSDGAAWGDVDGDGFLDLFVDHGATFPPFGIGPRELFLNTANDNHWIFLQLRGLLSNGSGIGARVRFETGSGTQWRTLHGESDNCFSSFFGIHAGLGSDTVCTVIEILWPSGQVDTHRMVRADVRYFAVEGEPLRVVGNPELALDPEAISGSIYAGEIASYPVDLGNVGGATVDYVTTIEGCSGVGDRWLSVDRSLGAVWPGGNPDGVTLTADAGVLDPGTYCGRLIFSSNSVTSPDTVMISIEVHDPTDARPQAVPLPERFDLVLTGPNPSRTGSGLRLALPSPTTVDVVVFDIRGRHVRTLLSAPRPAGFHRVLWDARDGRGRRVAPGVYLVRASTDRHSTIRKLVLVD